MNLDLYLDRIGYSGPRRADLATLGALLAHQADAIPFEAIDVLLGRGIDIAPDAIFEKLVVRKRGGYCFEQNGLLLQALTALGFEAETLIARVLWMRPADAPPAPPTHMALRVHIDGRDYLADAGFGSSTPTAPLDISDAGPQSTPLETFRLVPSPNGHILQMQSGADWLPAYEVFAEPRGHADFVEANILTSTDAQSPFTQSLILARATREARVTLLNNRLTLRPATGESEQRHFAAPEELASALAEVFRLQPQADWQPLLERFAAATGSAGA